MKYGVFDYILKPLDPEEIHKVFNKVRENLDKRTRASSLPFSYLEEEECQRALARENALLHSILGGNANTLTISICNWRSAIGGALREYWPLLVSHLFEELYLKLESLGIHLTIPLQKERIYQQIRALHKDCLLYAVERIVTAMCEEIRFKLDSSADSLMVCAQRYIEEHLSESFGVEDVAASVFLSSSHFSREFKSHTGESVMDYVIRIRMERAMDMIRQGAGNVAQIGSAVGYTDVKYYLRSFKKYTGFTVKEYRKLVREG